MHRLVGLLVLVLLAGCATPYQPYTSFSLTGRWGGYEDFPVSGTQLGRHFVSFESNPYTRETEVLESWHQRASELCPTGYEVQQIKCRCTDSIFFRKRAEGYLRCSVQPEPLSTAEPTPPKKKLRSTGDIFKGED